MTEDVLCLSCGSADTLRARLRGVDSVEAIDAAASNPIEEEEWLCLRCTRVFVPCPCPECGSYQVEGARGVSGQDFVERLVVVRCYNCRATFVRHPSS